MNSYRKLNLILIGLLFVFSPILVVSLSCINDNGNKSLGYSNDIIFDKGNLKISDVSGKIHIDNNWTAAKAAGICTGNGTYSEPYIIEDLIIEGGGGSKRYCILIENSNDYFRIENCTVFNAGGSSGNAGIELLNVTNGQVIDSDSYSNAEGIYLENCSNNTISENKVYGNYNGMNLIYCYNNTIIGNVADYNEDNGIILIFCNDNNVLGNLVNGDGILLSRSFDNMLMGNYMNGCGLRIYGFTIEELNSHNIDSTNLVNGKPLYYYTNEVKLGTDDFINAGQVILVNCNDSSVSNLNVSYTTIGISLYYCHNNEISGNSANNNILYGIYLSVGNNNLISGNDASNCSDLWGYEGVGIILDGSNDNTISDNIANNNIGNGIQLFSCENNLIMGNNLTNNYNSGIYLSNNHKSEITKNNIYDNWNGIYLRNCNENKISKNTADNNANGITLRESSNNDISENIVTNNDRGFLIAISSDNNTIAKNIAIANEYGIYLGVLFNNIILENKATYNKYGIYLAGVFNATLSKNTVNSNWMCGIYLEVSFNNTISENIVNYNYDTGIILDDNSYGNIIFLNCFNNTLNARDDGSENRWDNGIKGNYWADYTGLDADDNGIGDIPYNISGSAESQDNFPLMKCPLPLKKAGGFPLELIILISTISGGIVIGGVAILLIRRKRSKSH
jgi:parallel beta-helix repeat protein